MPNLDQQLASWKHVIARAGTLTGDDMAELEGHVRETVRHLTVCGLSEQEALVIALRRIGDPGAVTAEYAKVNPGLAWARRWYWMTAGFLIFSVLLQGIDAVSYAIAWLALPTGPTMIGVSIIKLGCFTALAVAMFKTALLPSSGRVAIMLQRASSWCSQHPFATATVALALMVGFRMTNSLALAFAFRDQRDAAFTLSTVGTIGALVLPVLLFLWGRLVNPAAAAMQVGD